MLLGAQGLVLLRAAGRRLDRVQVGRRRRLQALELTGPLGRLGVRKVVVLRGLEQDIGNRAGDYRRDAGNAVFLFGIYEPGSVVEI